MLTNKNDVRIIPSDHIANVNTSYNKEFNYKYLIIRVRTYASIAYSWF